MATITVFGTTFTNVPKNQATKLQQMEEMGRTPVEQSFYTVEEYIRRHPDTVVDRRVSKKGIALITVQYPDEIRQYEESRIGNTCSFQYKEDYNHD